MSQPDQTGQKRRWNWVSVALFVIGLLILVPSGLCTALGLVFALSPYGIQDSSMVQLVLTFGALPIVLGIVLVWLGLAARARVK